MNRKDFVISLGFLYILIQESSCYRDKENRLTSISPLPLSHYDGPYGMGEAAHLLRRTSFGFSTQSLDLSLKLGLHETVEKLFLACVKPMPPINFEFENDIYAPIGTTWVNALYSKDIFFEQYRKKSLRAWVMNNIYKESFSIQEKMILFWHNHFGISDIFEHKFEYIHIEMLRTFAWGNFRELMKMVTIDPAMLRFLNGNENTRKAPNENYAREFLELFTVGKGPLIGHGDYTTFTEKDVAEIAKILTGWKDFGWFNFGPDDQTGSIFDKEIHTTDTKILSPKFDDANIVNQFESEYKTLIDIIFRQPQVAIHICTKLYRWFVHYHIDKDIHKNVITPLSRILIQYDFEIKPVLSVLLKSKHFFERRKTMPQIKNPLEFMYGFLKYFPVSIPDNDRDRYNFWYQIHMGAMNMGMEYLKPPSVAGWKPYYQAPGFYRLWINAATLQARNEFCDAIVDDGYIVGSSCIKIDIQRYLADNTVKSVKGLIEKCNNDLSSVALSDDKKEILRNILLKDYSELEWSKDLIKYVNKGSGSSKFEDNMKQFLKTIIKMPEMNLS